MKLRRLSLAVVGAAMAICLPLAAAVGAGSPIPELTPSPRRHGDPPMRILRVVSSDPACGADCPEWISAEGIMTPGSAAAFAKIVADLGGRRLPVLISSHGGSVREALTMGVLIRDKGLAVAVARTLIANCPERAGVCPNPRGQAIVGGAACASACPFVLAAGVERLVGPAPLIGVHQITTVVNETEGVERLTRTVKVYEQDWVDKTVADYLAAMGVGEPVMTLLRKTPAASIRWLSLDEVTASGLATGSLDAAKPMLAEGANGLNGRGFGETGTSDALTAKVVAAGESGPTLSLTYRPGGGAAELVLDPSAAHMAPAADWSAAIAGGAPLALKASGDGAARGLAPRERFCALARDGRIVATPEGGAPPAPRPVAFETSAAAGVKALLAEACP